MNTDERGSLRHRDLADGILRCFYEVYNDLGFGFLESVYERAMTLVLDQSGLPASPQQDVTVHFRGMPVGTFRTDIVVADKVVIELKAARALDRAHEAQLLNFLRATEYEVGLLLNFGPRPEFKRIAFANERKQSLGRPNA